MEWPCPLCHPAASSTGGCHARAMRGVEGGEASAGGEAEGGGSNR